MSLFEAIVLGMIQGLTEFLPISSSGHLVLAQRIFGVHEAVLFFDVMLHVGTLVAVLIVFSRDWLAILRRPLSRLTWLLIAGLIPTGILGLAFKDVISKLFASGQTLGIEFLITGIILWWAEGLPRGRKSLRRMSYLDAAVVGTAQGLAILPALSRSGLTIAGALLRGLDRETAARYSFLLSAPAILGAALVELKDASSGPLASAVSAVPWAQVLAGMAAAAVFGYLAIKVMLAVLTRGNMRAFSYYVWAVGILVLLDQVVTHRFFPPLF